MSEHKRENSPSDVWSELGDEIGHFLLQSFREEASTMKLYIVGSGWGGSGHYVVIADSPERAVELVASTITVAEKDFFGKLTGAMRIRSVPKGKEQDYIAALQATELTEDLASEFVSEEWGEE